MPEPQVAITREQLADLLRPVALELAKTPDPFPGTPDATVVGLVKTWVFFAMAALEQSSPAGRENLCNDAAVSMLPILAGLQGGRYE